MRSLFLLYLLFINLSFCLSQRSQRTTNINNQLKEIFIDSFHSLNELVERATNEKKFIYIFCITSSENCGHFFESHFVPNNIQSLFRKKFIAVNLNLHTNLTNEFEFTKAPNILIDSIKNAYKITNTPAHIILNASGIPLTKFYYSMSNPVVFEKFLRDIIKGKRQFYNLVDDYKRGNRNPKFITQLIYSYRHASTFPLWIKDTLSILENFISAYPKNSLFTRKNAKVIYEFSEKIDDICSKNLFENRENWYKVLGKEKVDKKIIFLLSDKLNFMLFQRKFNKKNKESFEDIIQKYLAETKTYFEYNQIPIVKETTNFFYENRSHKFLESMRNYLLISNYIEESDININNFSWRCLQLTDDKNFLKNVLLWSKSTLRKSQVPDFIDSYANLLYKLGYKNKAIRIEKKAVKLSGGTKYSETLAKMRNKELIQY